MASALGRPAHEVAAYLDKARVLVVYDGDCGVCARFAAWLRARDRERRVRLLPSQTAGLLAACGLTEDEAAREASAFDRGGGRYAGAAAVNRALRELGGVWRALGRCYGLPGVRPCEDAAYRWFARNRGHFARLGVTPVCGRGGPTERPRGS